MVLSSSQLMRNFVKLLLTIKPNKEKKIVKVLILICWYVLEFIGNFNFGSAQRKEWGGFIHAPSPSLLSSHCFFNLILLKCIRLKFIFLVFQLVLYVLYVKAL